MSQRTDGQNGRGTILMASDSSLFLEIVGGMVADCGFESTTPAGAEPPSLSVTRTQPVLVICDCTGPATAVKQLVVEVVARRLPLLMAATIREQDEARLWILPDHVAWLSLPIARDAFCATIDDLLTRVRSVRHHMALSGAGVLIEAAVTVRTLDEVYHSPHAAR